MKHQYKEYYDNQEILVAKDHEKSYGFTFSYSYERQVWKLKNLILEVQFHLLCWTNRDDVGIEMAVAVRMSNSVIKRVNYK